MSSHRPSATVRPRRSPSTARRARSSVACGPTRSLRSPTASPAWAWKCSGSPRPTRAPRAGTSRSSITLRRRAIGRRSPRVWMSTTRFRRSPRARSPPVASSGRYRICSVSWRAAIPTRGDSPCTSSGPLGTIRCAAMRCRAPTWSTTAGRFRFAAWRGPEFSRSPWAPCTPASSSPAISASPSRARPSSISRPVSGSCTRAPRSCSNSCRWRALRSSPSGSPATRASRLRSRSARRWSSWRASAHPSARRGCACCCSSWSGSTTMSATSA